MPKLDVMNLSGEKVGVIDLADAVFSAPVKEHLLWEMVTAQRAAARQGTSSSKTRGEVHGSTRKIYRQKGTGRARHGSIKAPIFVGGGKAHGPHPRSYVKWPPKKVRRGALRSALSLRAKQNKLLVMENLELPELKTKNVVNLLASLGVNNGLIIDDAANAVLVKSVRNLPHSKYLAPDGLNVYDVLRYDALVVTASVAKQIEERLLP